MNQYQPLSSVWYGDDAGLLKQMLNFYKRSGSTGVEKTPVFRPEMNRAPLLSPAHPITG